MSRTVERLKKLFLELGLNADDGIISAEIEAYASAIELVRQNLDDCIKRIFIPNGVDFDALEYIELMGKCIKNFGFNYRKIIGNRVAGPWCNFTKTEFESVLKNINYFTSCDIKDGTITLGNFDRDNLPRIGDFFSGYIPPTLEPKIKPIFENNKSPFYKWDSWKKPWYKLDDLKLQFSIIDNLEVLEYE